MTDLWVVNAYFNPCRYKSRRANFELFAAGMKSAGAKLLTVELAFGEEEFELPLDDDVMRIRSDSVMWQKERLINIAVKTLPQSCRKVAWFDNDILFDDPRWLERMSAALETHVLVQPYSSCNWLAPGETAYPASGGTYESFGHCFVRAPNMARTQNYFRHGHTGFAWAARRDLFESCGLYDVCMSGSADHLMSHAFAGALQHSPCLRPVFGGDTPYFRHFMKWANEAFEVVGGRIGYVPGTVLHLWHGELANRPYGQHNLALTRFGFDPDKHLAIDDAGLYDWSEAAPDGLRDWAREIFRKRQEDGDPARNAGN